MKDDSLPERIKRRQIQSVRGIILQNPGFRFTIRQAPTHIIKETHERLDTVSHRSACVPRAGSRCSNRCTNGPSRQARTLQDESGPPTLLISLFCHCRCAVANALSSTVNTALPFPFGIAMLISRNTSPRVDTCSWAEYRVMMTCSLCDTS